MIFLLLAWKLYKPPKPPVPLEISVSDNMGVDTHDEDTKDIAGIAESKTPMGHNDDNIPYSASNLAYSLSLTFSSNGSAVANGDIGDVVSTHL